MNYKLLLADTALYAMKRVEMAEVDLGITGDICYEGEIYSYIKTLQHIDMLLSGESTPSESLEHVVNLIKEVCDSIGEKCYKYMDRWE